MIDIYIKEFEEEAMSDITLNVYKYDPEEIRRLLLNDFRFKGLYNKLYKMMEETTKKSHPNIDSAKLSIVARDGAIEYAQMECRKSFQYSEYVRSAEDALIELDRKMKADDKPSMKKTTVAGIVCYVCAALTLNSIRADIRIWGLFFAFVAVGTFFLTLPKIKQIIKAKINKNKNKKK